MLPIVDKPTLQYIVEEAIASGIEEILIITGRNKKSIEDHFDKSVELELELAQKGKHELLEQVRRISDLVNIHYVRQKEPKGLGHAVYCARSFIGNEPFAVLLGDDIVDGEPPCLAQLIRQYEAHQATILGVQEIPREDVKKYGIVAGQMLEDRLCKVTDLVEKPAVADAPSNIAILGRYIITPRIFELLQHARPGAGGEIQLTDALKDLARLEPMYAYSFSGRRYDVGDRLGFLEATIDFALRRADLRGDLLKYLNKVLSNEGGKTE
jgi:UTP--glucose-1-phosphate uridylyltransferase